MEWTSRTLPWLAAGILISSCGLQEPRYIDYADDDGATDGTTTECPAAQAAFDAQMQAAVASKCAISGCHLTQAVAGKALSASDAVANRTQLLAYNSSADRLYNKYSSTSHGGGNRSADLPKTNVDAWAAEEAKCP